MIKVVTKTGKELYLPPPKSYTVNDIIRYMKIEGISPDYLGVHDIKRLASYGFLESDIRYVWNIHYR